MADIDPTANPSSSITPGNQGSVPSAFNVSDWVKKFSSSEKVMKQEFFHKYNLAKRRLRSEYDVRNKNTKKMTHENVSLVYSIGQSFVNSVYFKAPICNLTARDEVEHAIVENTEIKVNDWLKDKKIKKAVKRIIWDAYLGGFGAYFIDKVYEDTEDQENVIEEALLDPVSGEEIKPAVFGRIVLKDDITLTRLRPDLVRFPRGFDIDNFQDSPWIGFDVITPLEEIKSNKNWDVNITSRIEGERFSSLTDSENRSSQDQDGDDLYVKLSYVFEKSDNPMDEIKLTIFCHKYREAPLQEIAWDKGTEGYPIKFLVFNPLDDDCSYPNGDPWNFESQSLAIDTWWQKMRRHVDRSNPKTIFDSGAISKNEIQNVKSNHDLEFIGIENKQKRDIQAYFYEMQKAAVHPDVTRFYEVARQLISELSPRSGLSRGTEDQQVDTATEAKIINTGEVIDIEARIDVIKDLISDIVLDVAGILENSQVAPLNLSKPVLDETGNSVIDPATGKPSIEIIKADKSGFTSKINVDVDVESMQAQNKDVFRRQLLDALKFLISFEPLMNKVGKTLNPLFWLERIMETMNIRNVEKGIIDLPPMILDPQGLGQTPQGPPSTIESGSNIDVMDDAMAERV